MAETGDNRRREAADAARLAALVALAAALVVVLWSWNKKLPPEVLGAMCGFNVCIPLVAPVSAASSPAAASTRAKAPAP